MMDDEENRLMLNLVEILENDIINFCKKNHIKSDEIFYFEIKPLVFLISEYFIKHIPKLEDTKEGVDMIFQIMNIYLEEGFKDKNNV